MRFSLSDLLIAIVCILVGCLAAQFLASAAGIANLPLFAGVALGVLAYLALAPWIYRRFRRRPLLLPRCPRCKDRNRHFGYEKATPDWPRDVVVCAACGTSLELWYESPRRSDISASMTSFELIWLQS